MYFYIAEYANLRPIKVHVHTVHYRQQAVQCGRQVRVLLLVCLMHHVNNHFQKVPLLRASFLPPVLHYHLTFTHSAHLPSPEARTSPWLLRPAFPHVLQVRPEPNPQHGLIHRGLRTLPGTKPQRPNREDKLWAVSGLTLSPMPFEAVTVTRYYQHLPI